MRRKIYESLLEWKASKDRKPLVVEGARQVGKTYILKEFGRAEYDNLIYINCHNNTFMHSLFQSDFDMERVLMSISAYAYQRIEPGKTLIFFDEVQEAPNALASLKYFCEDARDYHVVVAGSLLGITHRKGESYPVGKTDTLKLYPMTFEEFLWAKEATELANLLNEKRWNIIEPMDNKLLGLLRQYYYVGGMPEAVLSFITDNDIIKVRKIQKAILTAYEHDFSKHAGNESEHIRLIWHSIPAQLARENKKFIYGTIKKGARAKEFERAIQWLVDARIVTKLHRCQTPTMPLSFYEDNNAFKLYMLDVGLLGAMAGTPANKILINNDVFAEYKGAFSENYVLQQLKTISNIDIYYFSKNNSMMEVDFLVQTEEEVIPLEVKAENNVKGKSLRLFVTDEYAGKNLKALRCSMLPYKKLGWMENIPLYGISAYFNN